MTAPENERRCGECGLDDGLLVRVHRDQRLPILAAWEKEIEK